MSDKNPTGTLQAVRSVSRPMSCWQQKTRSRHLAKSTCKMVCNRFLILPWLPSVPRALRKALDHGQKFSYAGSEDE